MPQVSYVAYIDESGDDGLTPGASEWLVLSALVMRTEAQRETIWVRDILADLELPQRRHLHFKPLDDQRRLRVCENLAKLPVRCFAVMSNKWNMRGHENPRAARFNTAGRTWFYWWMTRLLLERVTDYCEQRSKRDYGEPRLVRFEFSRRKGLRYAHLKSYLYWLRQQSKANALYIKRGDLKWSVVDPLHQVFAFDHIDRAGLQLADTVASAFYQAVNGTPSCRPEYALALEPRMARNSAGTVFDYGLKLMPYRYLWRMPTQHRTIFDFYRRAHLHIVKEDGQAPGP